MSISEADIKKILIIDLGQVGDVIMSWPALAAVRKRFPAAELVVIAGKAPGALIEELGLPDRVIKIDRYGLLGGPKLDSIGKIFGIVRQVRTERFDLVIDLHSLHESNLLGFLSGAKHRLFANRRNRSLDFLSNVRPRPPLYDPSKHLAKIYLDVLRPLDVTDEDLNIQISPPGDLIAKFRSDHLQESGATRISIGLLTGAGNPSRKWPLENFVELAKRFKDAGDRQLFVFLGPEEKPDEMLIRERFGSSADVISGLTLIELAAAFSTLELVIGNDTGTTHLAAVTGCRVCMIVDKRAPPTFTPLGSKWTMANPDVIERITVDDVWKAVHLLNERTEEKKQPKKQEADQGQEH